MGDSQDFSVFVGDLAAEVSDLTLQEHFRQFFPSVRSAKVITDQLTGRSKGYGFVRFSNEQERDSSITDMTGYAISNRPIRVSVATARRYTGLPPTYASPGQPHPSEADPTNTTLFIGGLGGTVSEEDLRAIFGQYGPIVYTKIPPGKGCGFVQFVQRPSAEAALLGLQGQFIGTSTVRLSWGRSQASRSLHAAAAYQQPGLYGASAVPTHMAAGYSAYQAPVGTAQDPYAAYAYALSHQTSQPGLAAYQELLPLDASAGGSTPAALRTLLSRKPAERVEVRYPSTSPEFSQCLSDDVGRRQGRTMLCK